jgi:DNA-binding NarL/FixJ family response regulator
VVVVPAKADESNVGISIVGQTIEALVIDRQPLFLAALGTLLGGPPMSARVTSCPRSDTALEIIRGREIDLVFCELRAEPISGLKLTRMLADEQRSVPVILLGDRDDAQELAEALHSPAAGLFTKDATLDEFLVGVRAVLSGHRAIGAGLMGLVLSRLAHQPTNEARRSVSHLSPTELEILAMIGAAESVAAIAVSRGISSKTVRNHLAKIYRKLDVHGRTEAMLWAARSGLTNH